MFDQAGQNPRQALRIAQITKYRFRDEYPVDQVDTHQAITLVRAPKALPRQQGRVRIIVQRRIKIQVRNTSSNSASATPSVSSDWSYRIDHARLRPKITHQRSSKVPTSSGRRHGQTTLKSKLEFQLMGTPVVQTSLIST